ncbi:MAG: polysulfide reductase NrfD, partial [Candidatus Heimdallarchaeota archaeon]|nr:polysulfide reductase NrfD [Candidatus Heimdallarchaeota archaeon]
EMITLIALLLGVSSILIDMGQIGRIGNMIISPNIRSPLIWDLIAILLYLMGSLIFFYLPLIPDAAYYRDKIPEHSKFRKKLYSWISRGWTGEEDQKKLLNRNIKRMSIVIIPVMISVHTIIAWIMSMTSRVGWDSTIFGPYFVVGAIYSGIATVLMAMVLFTVFYKLDDYITKSHFISLSKLFLIIALTYAYFTISEYLTAGYKSQITEIGLLDELFYGQFSGFFWIFVVFGLIFPSILLILLIVTKNSISGKMTKIIVFTSALLVNVGMWIKRYLITVPTLSQGGENMGWVNYLPTSTEIWITLAQFSFFILLFIVLCKIFPIISLWEVEAGEK